MTVATHNPTTDAVTLTAAAKTHFEKKLFANGQKKILRLSTETSGCTGYAYVLDMVDAAKSGDVILSPSDKVTLAIDKSALAILAGTEIDYVAEGINRVVKFKNPNVVAQCGCGESFSVG
jgi:iron-sulfur cluster assembly accessory protein